MSPVPVEQLGAGKGNKWDPLITKYLSKNKGLAYSVDELAKGVGCSKATLQEPLKRLVKNKQVQRGRLGRKYYYHTK